MAKQADKSPKKDLITPMGRRVQLDKSRPAFPTGDNLVYKAHCGDRLSNMVVSVQDHWERPGQRAMLEMLDHLCDKYCVRGTA